MPYMVVQVEETIPTMQMVDGLAMEPVSITRHCWIILSRSHYSSFTAVKWKDDQPNKSQLIVLEYLE